MTKDNQVNIAADEEEEEDLCYRGDGANDPENIANRGNNN